MTSLQNVDQCRAIVLRIISLLGERRAMGDVLEFLVTVNFVSDVLNECRAHAATTPFDLGLITKYLSDYEELLMQLVTENRFQRFLTSNRVRKKLEILNSNLHTEVSKIFLRLRTDRRPSAQSARAQAPRAGVAMRDDTMVRYLNELEPAAKQMWEENFGENPMAEWSHFMRVYSQAVRQPVNESGLRYLLDNAGTNSVSLYKFCEFLKGFGPLSESPRRVVEVISADWFHGYLSSDEAVRLLYGWPPNTFLVRISKSRLGAFALAYVNEQNTVVHTLISTAPPYGFKIDEEVNQNAQDRVFASLSEIVKFYYHMLKHPFDSSLAREAWFHGDLSSQEAQELLEGKPNGTFLFRFSSYKGFLAVSYVEDGAVQHGKVEVSRLGFKFESEKKEYLSLQALVEDYHKLLVTPIDNTPFPTVAIRTNNNNNNNASSISSSSSSTKSYTHLPAPKADNNTPQKATPYQAIKLPQPPPAAGPSREPGSPGLRSGVLSNSNGAQSRSSGASGRSSDARRRASRAQARSASLCLLCLRSGLLVLSVGVSCVSSCVSPVLGSRLINRSASGPASSPNTPPLTNSNEFVADHGVESTSAPRSGGYGQIPNGNVDDNPQTTSNYGAIPISTEKDYGSVPVGAPNTGPSPVLDYGSIPVMTPPYGSVPVGENRRAGQSGGYGNVPSAPPNDPKYGSLPSGINGANGYGSIPEMK